MILSQLKNLKSKFSEISTHEQTLAKNENLVKEAKFKTSLAQPRNLDTYYKKRKEDCFFGPALLFGISSSGLALIFYIVICCLDRSLEWDILFTPGKPLTGGLITVAVIFGILVVGLYAAIVVIPAYFIDKANLSKREKKYDEMHAQELKNAKQADEKILSEQNAQLQKILDAAEAQKKTLQEKIRQLKEEIANDKCVPAYYKTVERLTKIISYFEQGRADTIKEALNLFAEEERYQQMMAMQQQANAQMQAEIASVRQVAEEAQAAASSSTYNGPSADDIQKAVETAIYNSR